MADENSLGPDTKKALQRAAKAKTELDLEGLNIHTLPPVADSVRKITIYATNIQSITSLPPALRELNCMMTPLRELPALPPTLEYLNCHLTPLTELPPLPDSLRQLYVHDTRLEELPPLPTGLHWLFCGGFPAFTHLPPELPPSLRRLSVQRCPVNFIPPLPQTLQALELRSISLRVLPELPESLKEIFLIGMQLAEPFQTLYDQYKVVWGPAENGRPELSYIKQRMPAFRAAVNAAIAHERERQASGRAKGRNLIALSQFAYGPPGAAAVAPPANNPFRGLPNEVVRRVGTQLSGINAPFAQQLAAQKEAASRPLYAPGAGANFAAAAPLVNNTLPALEPATGGRRNRRTLKRKGYKAKSQKSKKRTQRR